MVNEMTPIGTICEYDGGTYKLLVKYTGKGDNVFYFSGVITESSNQRYPVGLTGTSWNRSMFNCVDFKDAAFTCNDTAEKTCEHKFVNVSFNQIKMECKFCGIPQS